ncbi:MAG TPA: T9SS type A sorting domain-containing protein [Candidatus Kapabacteria bacterium]
MTSSFTAVGSGVSVPTQPAMQMEPIYPNPAAEQAMVHFTLDEPQHVRLRIYDAEGTLVQTPIDENMTSGFHMLMIDTKSLPTGSYQYVLDAGGAELRRSAIVIK